MKIKNLLWVCPLIVMGFVLILTNSCNKDDTESSKVTDKDGNVYKTVKIGTQVWMAENLKTTKYHDGTAIPNITDITDWNNQTTGAYCWYDNDINNKTIYGALYNYYTVVDSRKLCPTGWHVPTDVEWSTLETYLGGDHVAAGKLKTTTLWRLPNADATNSSGFTALPGGYRDDSYSNNSYGHIGYGGFWWSSTAHYDDLYAWFRYLYSNNTDVYRGTYGRKSGLSVRCLKDL